MENENLNFEDELKDAFKGFGEEPDEKSWENIQQKLHPQKSKKRLVWWYWAAAASVISIVLAYGWFQNQPEILISENHIEEVEKIDTLYSSKLIVSEQKEMLVNNSEVNEETIDQPDQLDQRKNENRKEPQNSKIKEKNKLASNPKNVVESKTVVNHDDLNLVNHEINFNVIDTAVSQMNTLPPYVENSFPDLNIRYGTLISEYPEEFNKDNIEPDQLLLASNIGQSNGSSSRETLESVQSFNSNVGQTNAVASFDMANEYNTVEMVRSQHDINYWPVTYDITMLYPFNKRLSIESGVCYTMLRGNSTSLESGVEYFTNEHYIGMPLRGSFNFMMKPRMNLFASLGASFELGTGTKLKTDIKDEGTVTSSTSMKYGSGGNLSSVYSGLGAEYALTQKIYLNGRINRNSYLPILGSTFGELTHFYGLQVGARFRLK